MPERFQLSRARGWRKPEGAVGCARPSRWGNWYVVHQRGGLFIVVRTDRRGVVTGPQLGEWDTKVEATKFAVMSHESELESMLAGADGEAICESYLGPLRGKDLGCWCALDAPYCHVDTLLRMANQ